MAIIYGKNPINFHWMFEKYLRIFDEPPKSVFPKFDNFSLKFQNTLQNENYWKNNFSRKVFPWTGKIQFPRSCWNLFWNFWTLLLIFQESFNDKQFWWKKSSWRKCSSHVKCSFENSSKNFRRKSNFFPLNLRKQLQAYYIFKNNSTKWTLGHLECRLATSTRFFRGNSGDFLPKV